MKKSVVLVFFTSLFTSCQGLNNTNSSVNENESGNTFEDFGLNEFSTSNSTTNIRGSASDNGTKQNTLTYLITFVNHDKTPLYSTSVGPNQVPVYEGPMPTKDEDSNFRYVFNGWSPTIVPAYKNQTYVAQYTAIYKNKEFNITWQNYDGTVLQRDTFIEGSTPFYSGPIPKKESDERLNYYFSGWDQELEKVYSDKTYVAVFTPITRLYKVSFYADENTLIKEKYYEYEEMPSYGKDNPEPTKESTQQETFTFKKWDKEFTPVTDDQSYYAIYESSKRKYTVSFYSDNTKQTLLYSKEYEYGETPKYVGDTPKKEKDEQYKYSFDGWNTEISPVVGDADYYALYSKIERTLFRIDYCMSFMAAGGNFFDPNNAERKYVLEEHYVENGDPLPESDYLYTMAKNNPFYSELDGNNGGLGFLLKFDVRDHYATKNEGLLPNTYSSGFVGNDPSVVNRLKVILNDLTVLSYWDYISRY